MAAPRNPVRSHGARCFRSTWTIFSSRWTGQIAGLAAAEALDQRRDVGQLDPDPLPKKLEILTEPA
ncbi:MAG: hypothetical protein M3463_17020 [Verrucomicrobiota bacterium]|nr:hypothetical protein [Verrucomicrobiota bacterium]